MLLGHPTGLIVVDRESVKELFEASPSDLNFLEAFLENTDLRPLFKADLYNTYHVGVLRNQLTHHIPMWMPDIVDELNAALDDEFGSITHGMFKFVLAHVDWTPIIVFTKVQRIVTRVTNRAFVGLPLCE